MWRRVGLVVLVSTLVRAFCLWLVNQRLPFLTDPVGDAGFWMATARLPISPDAFVNPPGAFLWLRLAPTGTGSAILLLFVNSISIFLAAALAYRLFGPREALRATILLALAAALPFFDTQLLEAGPSALLVTGVALLIVLADRTSPHPMTKDAARQLELEIADGRRPELPPLSHRVAMAFAGLGAGILVAFIPGFLLAGVAIALWLLTSALGQKRHRSLVAGYAIGLFLGLAPVLWHNTRVGVPVAWPAGAGVRIYQANHPGGDGLPGPIPPEFSGARALQPAESDSFEISALGRILEDGPALGYWTAIAVSRVFSDIGGWVRLEGRKIALLVTRIDEEPGASSALELQHVPHRLLMPIPTNVLLIIGAIGVFLAAGSRRWPRGARGSLAAVAALLIAVVVSALVEWPLGRLRFAVLPLLSVFAAHAMVRADDAWQAGRRRAVLVTILVAMMLVAITWRSPAGPWRRPNHEASLLVAAGVSREARGDTTFAEALFAEALKLDETHLEARMRRSERAMQKRDLGQAIVELEAARKGARDDFSLRNNLGILYVQAQRFTEAEAELETATHLNPESPGPWYWRGQVARLAGDTTAAISHYREAIKLNPHYTQAWSRLIDTLLRFGRAEEARQEADRATEAAVALPADIVRRIPGGVGGK
ncbi:MAG: tetratricopeptide repeat protein [Candidatus Eisenbacteria bacterium]|nr:tetratricopeptide repeat protein [Candidatus Eisenbacteria bacterium]